MSEAEKLYLNGTKVNTLYRAVRNSQAIELIPALVKQIISEEMWREHTYEKTNETFKFDSFQKFVETHTPDGLGTKVETLFKLCLDDSVATELIDKALESFSGSESDEKTIIVRPAISTARQAGLRRLRRYAEQNEEIATLHQAVLAGEISMNAAMIKAGLRKPRITIPKDVGKATQALRRIYSSEDLQKLIKLMSRQDEIST